MRGTKRVLCGLMAVCWLAGAMPAAAARPETAGLRVPVMCQKPELYNGCEVTSLAMMLRHAGQPVSKMELAAQLRKDLTPEVRDGQGRTLSWGDPNRGFVGDITGRLRGYGVYHGPVRDLLEARLPGKAVDLTGSPFESLLDTVAAGRPVVVWTTTQYRVPAAWVYWRGPGGTVKATFSEHAVLLVGYGPQTVTVNDPLTCSVRQVDRVSFRRSWEGMGAQAVTYR